MIAIGDLAAEARAELFLILAGVFVVVLLIGAVWYGSKRVARRRAAAQPSEQNPAAQRRAGSWETPQNDQGGEGPRP
ncbi:DUF6479 family protein [Streptomyces sp. NPDC050842]|uniref:DUF6479 family protein n=1 Tax=Streptomyces sp. NPDC050842 TaxID=3365636 RepID=UPI0037A09372